jgi:hypothetical protein
MKSTQRAIIFLMTFIGYISCMENNDIGFTVSPAVLSLNPNKLLYHPTIEQLTIYEKYVSTKENDTCPYSRYFKATNNLKVIQLFCQSKKTLDEFIRNNPNSYVESQQLTEFGIFDKEKLQKKIDAKTKETDTIFFEPLLNDEVIFLAVLLPNEIQGEILKWCHIFPDKIYDFSQDPYNNSPLPFHFKGFLNEQCAQALLHKTFHLPDFDVTCNKHKDKFLFDISLKNPSNAFDIIATLKKAKIIPDQCTLHKYSPNEKYPNKATIELTIPAECLGRPFIITPFFPQKERFYHSGRFGGQFQKEAHFHDCNIRFDWYVRSYYYLNISPETKIFVVELMDETIDEGGGIQAEHHSWNTPLPQNHHIEIRQYDTTAHTHKEIQKIKLPVAHCKPDDDHISKPFSNARFKIIAIINNMIVLYDSENNVFPCFATPTNDEKIIYEEKTVSNIKFKNERLEAKKKKLEEQQLKRNQKRQEHEEFYNKYHKKPRKKSEEPRKKSLEKIKKYSIPIIICILVLYKVYLERHLLYNGLKSIHNFCHNTIF